MSRSGSGATGYKPSGDDGQRKYPLFVRALAVVYVLSYAVQVVGFLLFCGAAGVLYTTRREVNGWVVGLALAGVACLVLCPAYRGWYRWWWEKRYPPAGGVKAGDGEQRPSP